jgi:hypothetical protein
VVITGAPRKRLACQKRARGFESHPLRHFVFGFFLVADEPPFYLNPSSGEPHVRRHGIDESEVEQVLQTPGEDRPGREGSRVAIGQTESGRYLRVVYVADPEPNSVFVITAYELKGKPLIAYRRRRRHI